MKKVDLERRIATLARDNGVGFTWVGGAKHDKYLVNGVTIIVPRHREIGEMLAKKIFKDCENALHR